MELTVIQYDVLMRAIETLRDQVRADGDQILQEYTPGEVEAALNDIEDRLIRDNVPLI